MNKNNKLVAEKKMVQNKKKNIHKWFIIGMLAWPLFHLFLFSIIINISTIYMSFMRYDGQQGHIVGLYNYKGVIEGIFETGAIKDVFINSITVLPLNIFVTLPLAILFSYFLFKKILFYKAFRIIFFLPSIISIVVLIMSFRYMFDENFGLVTIILKNLGLSNIKPELGWFGTRWSSWKMLWMFLVWAGIGYNIMLIQGAMIRVPQEILESAKLDGVNMFYELTQIIIPLIIPTISTMIFFATMGIFTMFVQPQLMFGLSSADRYTVALYIVNQTKMGGLNGQAGAAALGICVTLIGGPLMIGLRAFVNKITPDIEY